MLIIIFRAKRVAPTLIREITRRVNLKGIFQACYTAGVVIPKPVGISRYHHRNLNPKKLVAIQFTSLGKNQVIFHFFIICTLCYMSIKNNLGCANKFTKIVDNESDDKTYESSRPAKVKFYKISKKKVIEKIPSIPGLRKMERRDCKNACKLLTDYLAVRK